MKTVEDKIKYFTERVYYWQKKLGVTNWRIYVSVYEGGYKADWTHDIFGKIISIFYSEKWIEKADEYDLDLTAFHEVYEAQFAELKSLVKHYLKSKFFEKLHDIVRRAENTIYPLLK